MSLLVLEMDGRAQTLSSACRTLPKIDPRPHPIILAPWVRSRDAGRLKGSIGQIEGIEIDPGTDFRGRGVGYTIIGRGLSAGVDRSDARAKTRRSLRVDGDSQL